jgi:hypothetical protein
MVGGSEAGISHIPVYGCYIGSYQRRSQQWSYGKGLTGERAEGVECKAL